MSGYVIRVNLKIFCVERGRVGQSGSRKLTSSNEHNAMNDSHVLIRWMNHSVGSTYSGVNRIEKNLSVEDYPNRPVLAWLIVG